MRVEDLIYCIYFYNINENLVKVSIDTCFEVNFRKAQTSNESIEAYVESCVKMSITNEYKDLTVVRV